MDERIGAGTTPVALASPPTEWRRAELRRVAIRSFRNLERVDLEPAPDGLALIGENGQGKTNFLEALHYLQLLRSFRGARDGEVVAFGAAGFHLAAELCGAGVHELSVGVEPRSHRKRVLVDGAEPDRLSDALGTFPAVLFSPQDADLVAGSPGARRRYLDVMLALTSRPYLAALQRYRAALARRNAALREPAPGRHVEERAAVWEPPLAESGAVLWRARRAWVVEHAERYAWLCGAIGESGEPCMRYVSALADRIGDEAGDAAAEGALRAALEEQRGVDRRRGLTHTGPHRDDLSLTLDSRELRTYGSAGQHRTAAIALRLLEGATRRAHARAEPVVLLDDPFAELDARRAQHILELLAGEGFGQTVLAVPREDDIPRGLTRLERWRISSGALARADR